MKTAGAMPRRRKSSSVLLNSSEPTTRNPAVMTGLRGYDYFSWEFKVKGPIKGLLITVVPERVTLIRRNCFIDQVESNCRNVRILSS